MKTVQYRKTMIIVFIICFILVTPITAGIVKEQLIVGDIGTAGWIETWECRLRMLVRNGLLEVFIVKVVVMNSIISLIASIISFLFVPSKIEV
ncbi:hypothetical protein [Acetivibrio cellulolyticus]|uniref:hypothetical protein n=1 Tax=Acetivibrio cellulolyticus TaxID=35830 RepID=UPI0001E2C22A|nr:hypothetical protein [Acetivibrio cellulolyticus]